MDNLPGKEHGTEKGIERPLSKNATLNTDELCTTGCINTILQRESILLHSDGRKFE